jgi:hypothetical protein
VTEKLLRPLRARLAAGPIEFFPKRFIAEGEYVVMQAQGRATAKSGGPYNNTYCIVCRIADGKIKEMTDYVDTELTTSALRRRNLVTPPETRAVAASRPCGLTSRTVRTWSR